MKPSVRMEGVTQRFGALIALDAVSFSAYQGEIHALVGENGAGKTTLMRVLYGALEPSEGNIELDGERVRWRDSSSAISHGIGMVSQHYSIIPELTCLQNLVLGAEGAFFLDRASMTSRAEELATKMGFSFDWGVEAATLSPASAQKLEIVKLLWRNSRIMILDEPTAMLSPADADALYVSLRELASEGATVIVVTHRIPEVLQHCDRITVLRGGKLVAELPVSGTSSDELAKLIVGHSIRLAEVSTPELGDPLLVVNNLTVRGARKDDAVKSASFIVNSGEVVGLAGVDGNGQRELFHSLVGTTGVQDGSIVMFGHEATGSPTAARLEAGLRLIPEDRHEEGVIEDWSLTENAALGLQRLSPLAKGRWNDLEAREDLAGRIAERFRTKHSGLHKPLRSLSGGNQQRFIAARALELQAKLILAFQPTRGLDIDGTAQVYAELRATCRAGAGALIVSYDLDELLENCDRVLVINGGRIFEPAQGRERDRQEIGRLMVGAG